MTETELLTTAGTAHRLEQLVTQARSRLLLISPYLSVSPILLERLRDARKRGVEITVICREAALRADERVQLEHVGGVELKFLPTLHAKCYLSEAAVVVTSMNLYQFSEKNNWEMGVFIPVADPMYARALTEAELMLSAACPSERQASSGSHSARSPERTTSPEGRPAGGRSAAEAWGFCVRCHLAIPLNSARPFCGDCFVVWDSYGNADYPEDWCHQCGRDAATSMAKPLCRRCYSSTSRNGKAV